MADANFLVNVKKSSAQLEQKNNSIWGNFGGNFGAHIFAYLNVSKTYSGNAVAVSATSPDPKKPA
jgi:hypothetical protein